MNLESSSVDLIVRHVRPLGAPLLRRAFEAARLDATPAEARQLEGIIRELRTQEGLRQNTRST